MFEVRQIGECVFLIAMAGAAMRDVRDQEIPVLYLAGMTGLTACCQVIWHGDEWALWLPGLIAGIGFLLLSKLTREGIGYGDSWMILNMGLFLGIWKWFAAIFLAFLLVSLTALAGTLCLGWGKRKRIPFFPFLLAGYVGGLLW